MDGFVDCFCVFYYTNIGFFLKVENKEGKCDEWYILFLESLNFYVLKVSIC